MQVPYSLVAPAPIRLHRLQLQGFRNHTVLQLELTQPRQLDLERKAIGKSDLLEEDEELVSLRSNSSSSSSASRSISGYKTR